jgi:hypothetical protein
MRCTEGIALGEKNRWVVSRTEQNHSIWVIDDSYLFVYSWGMPTSGFAFLGGTRKIPMVKGGRER